MEKLLLKYLNSILVLSLCSCSLFTSREAEVAKRKSEIFYTHGTQALMDKEYTKALSHLLNAEKLDSENADIQINLAMAYFYKDEKETALKHLNKALEIEPENPDARSNVASIYFSMGQLEKSKKLYKEVLKDLTYERNYRVYYNLGLISLKENDREGATENFMLAIKSEPAYCPAHYQLGIINKEQYKYQEALENFNMATEGICSNRPGPFYEQALTLMELKQFRKARSKMNYLIQKFNKSEFAKYAKDKLKTISILEKRAERMDRIEENSKAEKIITPNF
ncbi:MAG: tetratricopeptide repeat protein [Halobacteriovoraceae bacterium]|nr:tetratricopeptide repeat protein [Halobacteriovoraceae bacterium]